MVQELFWEKWWIKRLIQLLGDFRLTTRAMKFILYIIYESTRLLTKESEQHRVPTASFALFCIGLIYYFGGLILLLHILPKEMEKSSFMFLGLCILMPIYFLLEKRYLNGDELRSNVLDVRNIIKFKTWQLHFISFAYNVGGILFLLLVGIYS